MTLAASSTNSKGTNSSDNLSTMSDTSDETPEIEPAPRPSLKDRFLKPPKERAKEVPVDFDQLPPAERKIAMRTMDRNEIRFGYLASAIALLFSLLATVPFMFGPSQVTKTAKEVNGACPATYELVKGVCTQTTIRQPSYYVLPLILYLVLSLSIFVTTRMKRRVATTFTTLLTGVAFTSISIAIGAPLLIYGIWLFLRARRIQRFGTTDAKIAAKLSAEQRVARKNGAPRPTARERAKNSKTAKPTGPQASKRYTPKKPVKKKPLPKED